MNGNIAAGVAVLFSVVVIIVVVVVVAAAAASAALASGSPVPFTCAVLATLAVWLLTHMGEQRSFLDLDGGW